MRHGPEWFIWIETLGIISFAVNAMIVARAKELSPFGVFLCAAVTALGGGTLRDLLLGPEALPFFWAAHPFYIVAIFAIAMAYSQIDTVRAVIARRDRVIKESAETAAMASLGALGAGKAFAILGPGDGSLLSASHLLILCATLGALSAAAGSVLRDVLLNEFPGALRPGPRVLESLFAGCLVLVGLRLAGVDAPWALLVGFILIVGFRTGVLLETAAGGTEKRS